MKTQIAILILLFFEEIKTWKKPKIKLTLKLQKKPTNKRRWDDPVIAEALQKDNHARYTASSIITDLFNTYGQHVTNKLRIYSTRTSAMTTVEHLINNICCGALRFGFFCDTQTLLFYFYSYLHLFTNIRKN